VVMGKGERKSSDVLWLVGLLLGLVWSVIVPFVSPYFLATHTIAVEALGGTTLSMVTAGAFARLNRVPLLLALGAPLVAVVRASPFYWWAGKRYGHYVVDIFAARSPHAQKMARRTEVLLKRLGPWAVVFAYFLPVPNGLIFAMSGWAGMSLRVFLLLDLLDAFLYSLVMVFLGYFLGQGAITVARLVDEYAFVLVTLSIVGLVLVTYLRRYRRSLYPLAKERFLGAEDKDDMNLRSIQSKYQDEGNLSHGLREHHLRPDVLLEDLERAIGRPAGSSVAVGIVSGSQREIFISLDTELGNSSKSSFLRKYHLGSFSSVLTATYLGSRVSTGAISLNESWSNESCEDREDIPFGRLATHTSGLPFLPWNFLYKTLSDVNSPLCCYNEEDLFRSSRRRRRVSVGYRYSNVGMSLVGLSLGGGTLEGYKKGIEEAVLAPLGMDRTDFLSAGHDERVNGFRNGKRVVLDPSGPFTPAMGIVSTPRDLMLFLKSSIDPESSPLAEGLRLSQRTHSISKDSSFAMGLGWHIFLGRQGTWLYHEIRSQGSSGVMAIHPQRGWGIFALSDCGDTAMQVSLDAWVRAFLARSVASD